MRTVDVRFNSTVSVCGFRILIDSNIYIWIAILNDQQLAYTWDAGMQWRQWIWTYLWSDINDAILCVRQIVYMNKNGGF